MSFSRRCHRITFMVKDTLGANQVGGMLSRLLFFFPYFVILTTSFPIWNLDSKQDYSIEPSIRTWTVDTLFRNDCKMSHYYSVAGRHCCLKFVCCVAFQRLCIISSLELVYMLTTCDLLWTEHLTMLASSQINAVLHWWKTPFIPTKLEEQRIGGQKLLCQIGMKLTYLFVTIIVHE